MSVTARNTMVTGLGEFSKVKFAALIEVRSLALTSIRHALSDRDYTEVSMSSLVNVAGSCENPYASFTLPYYGREAHLSQSAQLQLEALVLRLRSGFYTVNNSFREEHFDDPEAEGRRLSEFTLIEPEAPYPGKKPEEILDDIIRVEQEVIQYSTKQVLRCALDQLCVLGADTLFLERICSNDFNRITYDDALELLNKNLSREYSFGDDLGVVEEREILRHFDYVPTFVTHFPSSIKFFNMKRMPDKERVYSVDLLMPRLGETTGGAVREESGDRIAEYLLESKVADYARERGLDPLAPFKEYFRLFKDEELLPRGGFGIGFERFVGFLLGSNDILDTIAYRSMQP